MNTIKPITPTTSTKRNDRYAEHDWHKHLNETQSKKEKAAKLLSELRAKGHIINILA